MNVLPFIPLDEEVNLNIAILIIILSSLSKNKNGVLLLDKDKIQIFMYLIKNPSKLEEVLLLTGKKTAPIDTEDTFTMKSLSLNVDMLFDSMKVKSLLKKLALLGMLNVSKVDGVSFFSLTECGDKVYQELDGEFFMKIKKLAKNIDKIKSLTFGKLNSLLNEVFKVSK
jgi:hypothetical protein